MAERRISAEILRRVYADREVLYEFGFNTVLGTFS